MGRLTACSMKGHPSRNWSLEVMLRVFPTFSRADGKQNTRSRTITSFPTPRGRPAKIRLTPSPENSRKCKRDSDPSPERKKRRPDITSAPGRVNLEIDSEGSFSTQHRRQHKSKQPVEVCRGLMDLLPLRPHVTVGLVDCDRIEFYHADHSVVLVSSVIDLHPTTMRVTLTG